MIAGVAVGVVAGFCLGLWLAWRQAEVRRMDLGRQEAQIDAWRLADRRADLDNLGPVTPPGGHRTAEPDWPPFPAATFTDNRRGQP